MRSALILVAILAVTAVARSQESVSAGSNVKQFAPDSVHMGWQYLRKGDYEEALRRFRIAVKLDENSAAGYYGIACVYSAQGKFDDSIKFFREALKRDPLYADTYANLGYALMAKQQYPEAVQMLDKAIELDPNCGDAYLHYANYYAIKQDWKSVEQSVNKALKCGKKIKPELRKTLEQRGLKIDQG